MESSVAGGTAVFDLNGFNQTVGLLTLGGATGASATSVSNVVGTGSTLTDTGGVTFVSTGNPLGSTISVATLDLNGAVQTFTVGDSTTAANDLTVSSVIQDGGISKAGLGTLLLSGANTYTGATTVTAGVLTLSGNNTTTGTTTLTAGTLNINSATALGTGAFTITAGTIDNTSGGALTETNNNALTINGSFTFTGSNSLNLGTGAISLNTATITVAANTLTLGGAITSTHSLTKAGAGTLVLGGANTGFTGPVIINAGTLQLANAAALSASDSVTFGASAPTGTRLQLNGNTVTIGSLASNTVPGSPIVENGGAANATLTETTVVGGTTFAGVIQDGSGGGTLGLTTAGTSSLILTNTNTYTGATTIGSGSTLQLGAATALGSLSTSSAITDNGTLTFNRTNAVTQGTDFGNIAGTGNVTQAGTSTLTLNAGAGNTYTGTTTVTTGTLAFTAGSLASTSAISLGGGTLLFSGVNTDDISAKTSTTASSTINIAGNSPTFAGTITGTNTLTLTGTSGSVLSLTGSGDIYANSAGSTLGSLTIDTIEVDVNKTGTSATLGQSGPTITIQNGGKLKLSGTVGTNLGPIGNAYIYSPKVVMTNGTLDFGGSSGLNASQLTGDANSLITNSVAGTTSTLFLTYSNTSSFAGTIQDGAGTVALNNSSTRASILTLSGNNTYSGGTTEIGDSTAAHASKLLLGTNTALGTGTLTLGGFAYVASDGATTRTLANNVIITPNTTGTASGDAEFGVATTNTGALNFGTLSSTSSIAQATVNNTQTTFSSASLVELTKAGAGILYIPGTYANSGTTTISAGTLALAGNNSGNGAVTVGDGTTLRLIANSGNTTSGISDVFGSNAITVNGGASGGPIFQLRSDSSVTFTLPTISGGTGSNTFTFDVNNVAATAGSGPQNNTLALSGTFNTGGTGAADHATTTNITGSNGYSLSIPTMTVEGSTTNAQTINVATGLAFNIGTLSQFTNTKGGANLVFNGAGTTSIGNLTSIAGSSFGITLSNGTLNLNGSNDLYTSAGYNSSTGKVTVNSGTLNLGNAGALNASNTGKITNLVLNGGSFDNTGGTTAGTTAYTTLAQNITQTWGGNFTFVGTNSLNTGTGAVTLTATPTVTVAANTLTVGGAISGAFGLTTAGAGTLSLTGTNAFTGATTVTGGTLNAAAANSLSTTSGITVNAGTLSVTASGALGAGVAADPNGATPAPAGAVPVTLSGGTFLRNGTGVSQGNGATNTVGIGMLTLTANTTSTLDFGTTGAGTLYFSSLTANTGSLLNVLNDNNTSGMAGTEGTSDRLLFNQDIAAAGYLNNIEFNGTADATEISLGNGEYEIIPNITAVPEPSTLMAGFLVCGVVLVRFRRSIGAKTLRLWKKAA